MSTGLGPSARTIVLRNPLAELCPGALFVPEPPSGEAGPEATSAGPRPTKRAPSAGTLELFSETRFAFPVAWLSRYNVILVCASASEVVPSLWLFTAARW